MRLGGAGGGAQQDGRHEGAALGVGVDDVDVVGVAEDDLGGAAQRLDRLADLLALVEAGERAHADVLVGRVADGDLREPRGDRLGDLVGDRRRDDRRAGSRCTSGPALTVISVTTPLTNRSNSGSSAVTSGPRIEQFSESASTPSWTPPCSTERVLAQVGAGRGGAGERDRVLRAELVEQAGGAAAEQLQRALGEDAGLDDPADDELGEVRRLAGRLDDRRQPGEEGRGELLEHAPDREVERVDLHRDAGPRGVDVLAEEGALPAELLRPAVEDDGVVGQLAGALAGVGEDRADAAVDVDRRVALGGAGAGGERVELVLALGEVLGQRLEQAGALVEGQRPERRTADRARVVGHRAEVEPGRGDPGDLLAGGGVEEGRALVGGAEPGAGGVALEQGLRSRSLRCHVWQTNTDRSVSKSPCGGRHDATTDWTRPSCEAAVRRRRSRATTGSSRATGCRRSTARPWSARSPSTRTPRSSGCSPRATGSPARRRCAARRSCWPRCRTRPATGSTSTPRARRSASPAAS